MKRYAWILLLTLLRSGTAAAQTRGEKMVVRFSSLSWLHWQARASFAAFSNDPIGVRVNTQGTAGNGAPIETDYRVWIHRASLLPQKIKWEEKQAEQTVGVSTLECAGARLAYTTKSWGPPQRDLKLQHPVEVHDAMSALLVVRAWATSRPQDEELELIVVDLVFHTWQPAFYRITARIIGREPQLPTHLGIVPALRIRGEAIRISSDGKPLPTAKASSGTLWLSDDDELRPVRIQAHLDWDDATLELVKYDAATAPPQQPASLPGVICRTLSGTPKPCLRQPAPRR
jgi:hypothetical protein